ncbi:hypothetical protein BOTBODRAFT_240645 [Botryobasidium botryosum FD-172 SS1]|uniref:Uncharacterized protein n=1 Tax=Botryobasidium botryosum (strain FD-172 SS1) TaxID=930990 RepID=A0A067MMN4_BOTB1|nr:hypothetical protein BOTBODRAFT_240645 [Botryobasidium botryosum FD-172 SS1]
MGSMNNRSAEGGMSSVNNLVSVGGERSNANAMLENPFLAHFTANKVRRMSMMDRDMGMGMGMGMGVGVDPSSQAQFLAPTPPRNYVGGDEYLDAENPFAGAGYESVSGRAGEFGELPVASGSGGLGSGSGFGFGSGTTAVGSSSGAGTSMGVSMGTGTASGSTRADMPKIQIPIAAAVLPDSHSDGHDETSGSPRSGRSGKGANPFFGGGSSTSLPLRKYSKQTSYFPPAQTISVYQQQQQQQQQPLQQSQPLSQFRNSQVIQPSSPASLSPFSTPDEEEEGEEQGAHAPFLAASPTAENQAQNQIPRDSVYSMSSKSAYSDLDSPFEFGQYLSGPASPVGGPGAGMGAGGLGGLGTDYRMEPRAEESDASLADNMDYSRRVLRVS